MTLTFRGTQFEQIAQARFEARLVAAIGEHDPAARQALDSPAGRQELRRQCERARGHGLRSELDVARYVVAAWLLGADFDTRFPALQQVLASDRLQAAQKADAIEKIALAVLHELAPGRA